MNDEEKLTQEFLDEIRKTNEECINELRKMNMTSFIISIAFSLAMSSVIILAVMYVLQGG